MIVPTEEGDFEILTNPREELQILLSNTGTIVVFAPTAFKNGSFYIEACSQCNEINHAFGTLYGGADAVWFNPRDVKLGACSHTKAAISFLIWQIITCNDPLPIEEIQNILKCSLFEESYRTVFQNVNGNIKVYIRLQKGILKYEKAKNAMHFKCQNCTNARKCAHLAAINVESTISRMGTAPKVNKGNFIIQRPNYTRK